MYIVKNKIHSIIVNNDLFREGAVILGTAFVVGTIANEIIPEPKNPVVALAVSLGLGSVSFVIGNKLNEKINDYIEQNYTYVKS